MSRRQIMSKLKEQFPGYTSKELTDVYNETVRDMKKKEPKKPKDNVKITDSKFKIKVPTGSAFAIDTPPAMFKLHSVFLSISKRGGGKTVSIANLFRLMKESGCLDRLILVSPTFGSNKPIFDEFGLDIADEDIIIPSLTAVDDVINIINQEAHDYDDYHNKMIEYRESLKETKSTKVAEKTVVEKPSSNDLGDIMESIPETEEYKAEIPKMEKPEHKWGGRKPVICCFFDDCQDSDVFSPRGGLSNLVIKHRHMGITKDGPLGISLFFACQNYTSNSGGIPKSVRGNVTHMQVFKTKNKKELDAIANECSGEISTNDFLNVYNKATDEPHSFLFVDFSPKSNHPSRFRKNFNEFIMP